VAAAHEFWLAPSRYEAAPGATLELSAVAGTGFRGERKPWSPDHAVRYVLRGAKPIDLTRAASPGEVTWTRFVPSDGGGALVAFESDFLPIELPAAQFDDYLRAEGLDGPLAARKGSATSGRERYRRCAKAWLAGNDGARATATIGLPLELVPDAVPGAATTLGVRLLRDGRPLAGALVKAWRAPLAPSGAPLAVSERDSVAVAWQGRSDAAGRVTIPVREAGEWLVSAVHMLPSADRRQADWESTWASLTFARVGGGAAPGESPRAATAPGVGPRAATAGR
jgi:hypothetical protein